MPLALWVVSGAPPAVAAPPTAVINVPGGEIIVGVPVTFTSASTDADVGDVLTETWDIGGDGTVDGTGPSPQLTFPTVGPTTVVLTVTDAAGETGTVTQPATVLNPNAPPAASFTVAPAALVTGRAVTFTSTSTDADGTITNFAWDFDGNGVNDANGQTTTHAYTTAGVFPARLTVTDNRGATAPATVQITVAANQSPLATFGFTPSTPAPGQTVTFASQASDPDGPPPALAWDLDNDGAFDDGTGATASLTFRTAGSVTVAHQATDDSGASTIAFQTVPVREPPSLFDGSGGSGPSATSPGATRSSPSPRPAAGTATRGSTSTSARLLMSPFPIVRIRGQARGARVSLNLVSVRAPRGATVLVRCKGRGCPPRRAQKRSRSGARAVRMRSLERNYAPGAVLEVYVSLRGRVGKYVRFRIRRGAAPARRDLCLPPRGTRPISCPGTSATPAAATE